MRIQKLSSPQGHCHAGANITQSLPLLVQWGMPQGWDPRERHLLPSQMMREQILCFDLNQKAGKRFTWHSNYGKFFCFFKIWGDPTHAYAYGPSIKINPPYDHCHVGITPISSLLVKWGRCCHRVETPGRILLFQMMIEQKIRFDPGRKLFTWLPHQFRM